MKLRIGFFNLFLSGAADNGQWKSWEGGENRTSFETFRLTGGRRGGGGQSLCGTFKPACLFSPPGFTNSVGGLEGGGASQGALTSSI